MVKTLRGRWVLRKAYLRDGVLWAPIRDRRTGKVHRIKTDTKSPGRAEQFAIHWTEEEEQRERLAAQGRAVRFGDAFREYLELKDVRPITAANYRLTFGAVYEPAFGSMLVGDIELKDVEAFLKKVGVEREVSARTKMKYLSELRSFFAWARRRRYCTGDPTEGLKVPRAPKRVGVALTVDEARALLQACAAPTVRAISDRRRKRGEQVWNRPAHLRIAVLIALHTGLRRRNVLELTLRKVDLAARRLTIPAEETKGGADLVLPLHPELVEVFEGLLRGKEKVEPDAPIIGREVRTLNTSFTAAVKRAGLGKVRFHDLRHCAATWWSTRASFAALRQLLGHSPGAVTMRYTHVPFEELRRVVDAGPRLLLPPAATPAEAAQPAQA